MATCDMGYEHEAAEVVAAEPEPVVVDNGPNENDVKIAEVEAAADIKRAEIYAEEAKDENLTRIERLEGELRGMREVLDRLVPPEPEPAPEPVIIDTPPPAEPEPGPPPPPETSGAKSGSSKGGGWWSGYATRK